MIKQTFCRTCGNPLPAWANGICYACERIHFRRPIKRHAGSTRIKHIRPERQKWFTPPNRPEPDWRLAVKKHVNGINLLLKDVYRRDVRISELMQKSRIPHEQVETWSKRKSWILDYLLRVEEEMRNLLAKVRPDCSPHILRQYYIDGLSVAQIAKISKQPVRELEEDYHFILDYLRSERGITALERIIVKCARFEP